MKIYSWNMYFRNADLESAFRFIESLDFDVFCLQEVPEAVLAKLTQLPLHLVSTIDCDRYFPSGTVRCHNVILSRHRIRRHGIISFPRYEMSLRTKLFFFCMRLCGWARVGNRSALWTDIEMPESLVRVFSLHLLLAYPRVRSNEFEQAMRERDSALPSIVCGDFNIIESFYMSPLNWIMGGSISEGLFWQRERITVEANYAAYGLKNPLRGQSTYPFAHSQLDHILVSQNAHVLAAQVLKNRCGSDHRPIFVETAQ